MLTTDGEMLLFSYESPKRDIVTSVEADFPAPECLNPPEVRHGAELYLNPLLQYLHCIGSHNLYA